MKKLNIFDRLDAYIQFRTTQPRALTKLLVHKDDLVFLFRADTKHEQLTGTKPFLFYKGYPVMTFKSQMVQKPKATVVEMAHV